MHQHTENWVGIFLGKKILDQNINPILEHSFVSEGHGGRSWSGPDPKGVGGALRTPKLLHGTMCFVGARGAGDFVLGGALARAVLKGQDFFLLRTALKDRP